MASSARLPFTGVAGTNFEVIHVRDSKTDGTAGGTFTAGAFRTRDLNLVVTNNITGASLAANQITLPAGTYHVFAHAVGRAVTDHAIKFRDTTNNLDLVATSTPTRSTANNVSVDLEGKFTLSASTVCELQHICSTTLSSAGFGAGSDFTGEDEVYSSVYIMREVDAQAITGISAAPLFQVEHQETSGTDGGSLTLGSWQTRILNTVIKSGISGASVSSNVITLPPGTYYAEAWATGYAVSQHKIRLRKTSATASDLLIGTSGFDNTGASNSSMVRLSGEFVLSASSTLELQHRATTTKAGNGLGVSSSFSVAEVYASIEIRKVT